MFVNAALIRPGHQPGQYPSGGPAAAPRRRLAGRRAERRLPGARHLLPRTSPSGRGATRGRATRCSFRGAAQRRSVGQRALCRSARTTRSASRRSASSRSPSRRRSSWRRATGSWRSSSRSSSASGQGDDGRPAVRGAGAAAAAAGAPRRLSCSRRPSSVARRQSLADGVDRDRRCSSAAAPAVGRPRALDGARRARHRGNGRHDHLRLDRRRASESESRAPRKAVSSTARCENIRWLSGDETHQGRHIRLEPGRFSLQRVRLYSY